MLQLDNFAVFLRTPKKPFSIEEKKERSAKVRKRCGLHFPDYHSYKCLIYIYLYYIYLKYLLWRPQNWLYLGFLKRKKGQKKEKAKICDFADSCLFLSLSLWLSRFLEVRKVCGLLAVFAVSNLFLKKVFWRLKWT
uniref:Uncharacterized protein n=1 Tax=Candidatus Kentrum sp. SD TaxID=2126332 RepID=A0A450YSA3_9GAMM|nr:MAG: hypothetical protein BECKSD772F_GA0070984_11784 [Candidatus Kentron sp. SD]VFK49352.1 MAG: hypothetical protein BECKSD772E_GA0070983_11732 [Candidatus Kentron sp. SD]VFK80874.1 MAG: hypothetical protein BECKSD772D_GA0070982_11712 [Candidatus Kentron sp. SD]